MADETKLTAATRLEKLLANIAGGENEVTPATRLEKFLSYIADAMEGGGGSADVVVLDVLTIPADDIPTGYTGGFVIDADINEFKDKKAIFLRSSSSGVALGGHEYGQIINLNVSSNDPFNSLATAVYGVKLDEQNNNIHPVYSFQSGSSVNMVDSYYSNKFVYLYSEVIGE